MRANFLKFSVLALGLASAWQHPARADATTEAQLRSALQSATTQIASLEDQVANLQASEAPDVAMIEALKAQLKSGGGAAQNSAATAKAGAALSKQLAARNAELSKSEAAYAAASSAASSAAAENAALKAQLATLNNGLSVCDAKNAALYKLGNQILDAYSHKDDIFGSIADREPFIGFKRVQLQNIVQDDQDKLYDDQVNPSGAGP
jgi:chromosome segregation ATPase